MIWWVTETKNKVSRKGRQMFTLTLSSRESILLKGLAWSDMEVELGRVSGAWQLGPGRGGRPTECGAWVPGEAPCSGTRSQCRERSEGDKSGELDVTAKDRRFQQWGRLCHIRSEVKSLSHVQLFMTTWTVAHQAPQSMEFSRQEYWSRLPFPSPGDRPNPGIEPGSPTLQADALPSEPPGKLTSERRV